MTTVRQNLQANIAELVKSEGGPKAFADKIGSTKQTVNNWLKGYNAPDIEKIAHIAHTFGLHLSDMLTDSDGMPPDPPSLSRGFVPVPLLGAVSGGIPIEMIEDRIMKEAPARFVEDDPDSFLVCVKGNSENRKHIFDGDFVLISPKYKEPKRGELFLVAVNGDEATLKEIEILENGIELIPDSYDPTYTRQVYDFNDPNTPPITVMGMYRWHCAPF